MNPKKSAATRTLVPSKICLGVRTRNSLIKCRRAQPYPIPMSSYLYEILMTPNACLKTIWMNPKKSAATRTLVPSKICLGERTRNSLIKCRKAQTYSTPIISYLYRILMTTNVCLITIWDLEIINRRKCVMNPKIGTLVPSKICLGEQTRNRFNQTCPIPQINKHSARTILSLPGIRDA